MTLWQAAGPSCPKPPEGEAKTRDINTYTRWQVDIVVQLLKIPKFPYNGLGSV